MSRAPSPSNYTASDQLSIVLPCETPSRPSHTSSALTDTSDTMALRSYIQTQKTGGSFTSALDTPSGTIGKAHYGYGYRGTVDGYANTFDSASEDEHSDVEPSLKTGPSITSLRGRTYSAPSISGIFSPEADQDAGDGTSRLIRNEPIAINGQGPSRVGKLRTLFEASGSGKPTQPEPISKQDTGNSSKGKGKPRISNTVRMLQAQLTGEQIDDTWNMDQFKRHSQTVSTESSDSSVYGTAKETLLKDALKMNAAVKLPSATDKSPDAGADQDTISRSSSTSNLFTPRLCRTLTDHDRDDSIATIKPLQQLSNEPATPTSPSRRGSPGGVRQQSRLTSIFASSPQSSIGESSAHTSKHSAPSSPAQLSPPPSTKKAVCQSDLDFQSLASDCDEDDEKSREPSVLVVEDDSLDHTYRLRANDGSCFELDWRANVSPTKSCEITSQSNDQHSLLSLDAEATLEGFAANIYQVSSDGKPLESARQASVPTSLATPGIQETVMSKSDQEGNSAPASGFSDQSRPASSRTLRPGTGKAARALFDFEGETAFNELSLAAGQAFEIISEELAGGWSLGVVWSETEPPRRGLIPQGWYSFDQDLLVPVVQEAFQNTLSDPAVEHIPNMPAVEAIAEDSPAEAPTQAPVAEAQPGAAVPKSLSQTSPIKVTPSAKIPLTAHVPDTCTPALVNLVRPASQISRTSLDLNPELSDQPLDIVEVPARIPRHSVGVDSTAQDRISNRPSESKIFSAKQADRVLQFEQLLAKSTESKPVAVQHLEGLPALSPALQSLNEVINPSTPSEPIPCGPLPSAAQPPAAKASIFGRKAFNRFASFVTSGAEDYVMSSGEASEDEQLRSLARKVSGGNSSALGTITRNVEPDESLNSVVPSALEGDVDIKANTNEHFVIAGPAGPKWKSKTPNYLVQVHHPEKRSRMNGMQEYTVYHVTCTFPAHDPRDDNGFPLSVQNEEEGLIPYDPIGGPYPPGAQVTVVRRFTQFEWLHQALNKHYAALGIPPVPEKQYSGRFASEFIETRRADLELWMSRIARHPVLRYSEPVQLFLSCDDDAQWRSKAAALLRGDVQGGFFACTWHPGFNFDAAEAATEAESMNVYLKTMERTINGVGGDNVGKNGVLTSFKGHRDGNVQTSSSYREMSFTLLRMLTGEGTGNNSSTVPGIHESSLRHDIHGPPMGNIGKKGDSGATNEHGAWCWREACHDCTNLTIALQNTADSLQDVADMYDHHARETLLRQHERIKDVSRPHASIQAVLDTHNSTLAKYRSANEELDGVPDERDSATRKSGQRLHPEEAEKLASRCETVINVTLSEIDRVHDERVEDWHAVGRTFLDSEIELYEGILETLRAARLHYEPQYYDRDVDTHILASRYQPDLKRPRKPPAPLQMPSQAQIPSGGLGANMGMLLSQATGGVTRPASAADHADTSAVDRMYDSTNIGGGTSPSGFVTNLLTRNKRSTSNIASDAASDFAQAPLSSPNKIGAMFSEFTNLPLPMKRTDSGKRAESYSQAGATLKAISQKQQQEEQRSSYFSAIWK